MRQIAVDEAARQTAELRGRPAFKDRWQVRPVAGAEAEGRRRAGPSPCADPPPARPLPEETLYICIYMCVSCIYMCV